MIAGLVSVFEDGKNFKLGTELKISIPGLSTDEVDKLIEAADKTCPFSNAVRGNVDVKYTPITDQASGGSSDAKAKEHGSNL